MFAIALWKCEESDIQTQGRTPTRLSAMLAIITPAFCVLSVSLSDKGSKAGAFSLLVFGPLHCI